MALRQERVIAVKFKRITMTINGNIEAIRKQLEEEHGVKYGYAQLIDYLINHYRKTNQQPKTEWRK